MNSADPRSRDARRVLGLLGGLSAIAPLGTDPSVPGLVEVGADLQAPAWAVQLSLTGFLVGIVAGRLRLGPLSDRVGRRRALLAGAAGSSWPPSCSGHDDREGHALERRDVVARAARM